MLRTRSLVAAMLVGVLVVAHPFTRVGAAPPYTLEERAAAIASPALIFIDVELVGYLRNRATGQLVDDAPGVVHSRCSGFVVSEDGHVVTTTHCLVSHRDSLRGAAAFVVANAMIEAGRLAPADKDAFIEDVKRSADFTGADPQSPPALGSVTGQLFLATTDSDRATTIEGRVVDSQPVDGGNVTLLKFDSAGLPVARLAPTAVTPDLQVVQVGFTSAAPEAQPAIYAVRSRGARVTGAYGSASPQRYQVDSDLGVGSDGGMIVDSSGNVIGMITNDAAAPLRANDLLVGADRIRDVLTSAGIQNALTPTDEAYRAGLDAYFGGHYSDAIARFETVLAQQPNNLPAQTYRAQASERLAIEGDARSSSSAWLLVAGAATIVVLLGIIAGLLWRGWRSRARDRAFDDAPEQYRATALQVPTSGAPVSAAPLSPVPMPGAPAWAPPPVQAPAPPNPPAIPTEVAWAPRGSVGGGAVPSTTTSAGQPPPHPTATPVAAWPAVTLWRNPHEDSGSVPPPGPAPSLPDPSTGQPGDDGARPGSQ